MKRIQSIHLALRGDAPIAVRRHGTVKQRVEGGKKYYDMVVSSDDIGWAAIQLAVPFAVEGDGGGTIRVREARGINPADVPEVRIIPDSSVSEERAGIVPTVALARAWLDAAADRVRFSVPLDVFVADYATIKRQFERVCELEDAALETVRKATHEANSWAVIRSQLYHETEMAEKQRALALAQIEAQQIKGRLGALESGTAALQDRTDALQERTDELAADAAVMEQEIAARESMSGEKTDHDRVSDESPPSSHETMDDDPPPDDGDDTPPDEIWPPRADDE